MPDAGGGNLSQGLRRIRGVLDNQLAPARGLFGDDPAVIERARAARGFPAIAGSLEEIRDQIGRYIEAKVDEFILPDFNLGRSIPERKEAYSRFIEDVAPAFV